MLPINKFTGKLSDTNASLSPLKKGVVMLISATDRLLAVPLKAVASKYLPVYWLCLKNVE